MGSLLSRIAHSAALVISGPDSNQEGYYSADDSLPESVVSSTAMEDSNVAGDSAMLPPLPELRTAEDCELFLSHLPGGRSALGKAAERAASFNSDSEAGRKQAENASNELQGQVVELCGGIRGAWHGDDIIDGKPISLHEIHSYAITVAFIIADQSQLELT